jgi:hypothetical protein
MHLRFWSTESHGFRDEDACICWHMILVIPTGYEGIQVLGITFLEKGLGGNGNAAETS